MFVLLRAGSILSFPKEKVNNFDIEATQPNLAVVALIHMYIMLNTM